MAKLGKRHVSEPISVWLFVQGPLRQPKKHFFRSAASQGASQHRFDVLSAVGVTLYVADLAVLGQQQQWRIGSTQVCFSNPGIRFMVKHRVLAAEGGLVCVEATKLSKAFIFRIPLCSILGDVSMDRSSPALDSRVGAFNFQDAKQANLTFGGFEIAGLIRVRESTGVRGCSCKRKFLLSIAVWLKSSGLEVSCFIGRVVLMWCLRSIVAHWGAAAKSFGGFVVTPLLLSRIFIQWLWRGHARVAVPWLQ